MSALDIGAMVFVCLCIASAVGMFLSVRVPEHHLNVDSRDVIKLATAVVGTLSALALGFLIASAKSTFNDAETEIRTSAAQLVLLDRVMAHYGPETEAARRVLGQLVEAQLRHNRMVATTDLPDSEIVSHGIEPVQDVLRSLTPDTQPRRMLQQRAIEVSGEIAEAHWLRIEKGGEGPPWPFLTILVFWLALLFFTFGLLAPTNTTVVCIIFVCALSVAGAVFLIIDLAHPYLGAIQVSDAPLYTALKQLGKA